MSTDGGAGTSSGGSIANPACSFSVPELLGNPNYNLNKLWSPSLTADELSLYFGVEVTGSAEQLGMTTRSDSGAEFGFGQLVIPTAGQTSDGTPFILPDGLTLYFYSIRPGGAGDRDLYVSKRSRTSDPFGSVQALSELNTAGPEHLPWVSLDQLTIYFTRIASGPSGADIWRATRSAISDPFSAPALVSELNSSATEDRVTLTEDQRTVIFASQRAGGQMQLYQATRSTNTDPFSTPQVIAELVGDGSDSNPALTPDSKKLYFTSTRNGYNYQLLRSIRSCP